MRLVPHREVGLDDDRVRVGPFASNVAPRWSNGSCDETRTALTPAIAASPSAPWDSAESALDGVVDLDDEGDPVALGDRLAQLAHETGS